MTRIDISQAQRTRAKASSTLVTPSARGAGVNRTGIVESLNALGVIPSAPRPNTSLEQVTRAILGVAGTISGIGNLAAQESARLEQEIRQEIPKFRDFGFAGGENPGFTSARAIEAWEQGHWTRNALLDSAEFPGLLRLPDDDPNALAINPQDTIEDIATRFISGRLQSDNGMAVSQAGRAAYIKTVLPRLAASIKAFQEEQRDFFIEEGVNLKAGQFQAALPEDMAEIVEQAYEIGALIGLTQDHVAERVVMPGARAAAQEGDVKRAEAMLAHLPDSMADTAANIIRAAKARQSENLSQELSERIRQGESPADIAADINHLADTNQLDERPAKVLLNDLSRTVVDHSKEQAEAAVYKAWLPHAMAAHATGGLATARGVWYEDAEGNKHWLPPEKIKQQTTDTQMSLFAEETVRENPGVEDPLKIQELALPRQLQWLTRNGVTYEHFERILSAGFSGATTTDLAKSGTDGLPANVAFAFTLYQGMRAFSPTAARNHIKDSSAYIFYRHADLAKRFLKMDDNTALFRAKQISNRLATRLEGSPLARIDPKDFKNAVDDLIDGGFFGEEGANRGDMDALLTDLASGYMLALGLNSEDALKAASEAIQGTHTNIDGWTVPTYSKRIPENIKMISRYIANEYFKEFGEGDGLASAEDIVLVPSPEEETWRLIHRTTYSPVYHWNEEGKGFFSDADLQRIAAKLKQNERDKEDERKSKARSEGITAAYEETDRRRLRKLATVSALMDITGFTLTPEQEVIADHIRADRARRRDLIPELFEMSPDSPGQILPSGARIEMPSAELRGKQIKETIKQLTDDGRILQRQQGAAR